jgi:hypothetical protein
VTWLSTWARFALLLTLCSLTFLPLASSQSTLTATVSADRAQYSPGEQVTISGTVRDSQGNPVLGAQVSIQVNDPSNNFANVQSVLTDQTGAYQDQFTLRVDAPQGQYTVYVTASDPPKYANTQVQAQFSVSASTISSTTSNLSTSSSSTIVTSSTSLESTTTTQSSSISNSNPPKCFIATATYGSALASEVTLLRNFRDLDVLRTMAGKRFMQVFNAFYYSFSPQVASYITTHSNLRPVMKIVLYPLIGVLYASSLLFNAISFDSELAVIVAGTIASLAIGAVYLAPFLTIARRLSRSGSTSPQLKAVHVSVLAASASLAGLLLAEITRHTLLLEITSASTVLSCITLGGLVGSWILTRMWSRAR